MSQGGGARRQSCDLVMKGGITSGVAYPRAVAALAQQYRFANVGGASAGAIAAAATAAAEYGRNRPSGGFAQLAAMSEELAQEGLLAGLFAPTRAARPVFRLLLRLQEQSDKRLARTRKAAMVVATLVYGLLPFVVVAALVGLLALAALVNQVSPPGTPTVVGWALLSFLVSGFAVLGLVAGIVARARRLLVRELPEHFFGLCTGMPTDAQDADQQPALTPWLHKHIQCLAGLTEGDAPLTFGDLADRAVTLTVMTTDVSQARPVQLPAGAVGYWYRPDELQRLFPPPVLTALAADPGAKRLQIGDVEYRQLPVPERLPVLVATRMSLSFPVLLSAVPLHTPGPDGSMRRHWLSDGGISSNFPIHLFDSWVPRRPTLALSFLRASADGGPHRPHDHCSPVAPPVPHNATSSVVGFLAQIVDTMQNWRDTLQSELPGFSDRVEPIALARNEGGMNLTMPPPVIRRLAAKGQAAGERLLAFDWPRHRFHRYRLTMRLLEQELGAEGTLGRAETGELLGLLEDRRAPFAPCGCSTTQRWRTGAARQTRRLGEVVRRWKVSFAEDEERLPLSVLRRTPRV